MIIGVGCDIVDHLQAMQLEWDSDSHAQNRIFSDAEMNLYKQNNNIHFLAGRFAVKESVLKCLKTGMVDGISLTEIEILKGSSGDPEIKLSGQVKLLAGKLGINTWHVSISHGADKTIAYVIAETN